MTRKVAWEKWWNSEQEEKEEDVIMGDFDKEDSSTNEGDVEYDQGGTGLPADMFFMPKKISTPFGQYESGDPMSPANMFDCWTCHTNFPICQTEYKILNEQISGIGAFKVISKYRFFIGVEKLFDFSDVRREIENKICNKDGEIYNFGVY